MEDNNKPLGKLAGKNMKVVVVLVIVGIFIGMSVITDSNKRKETAELHPVTDFSTYITSQYITNPEYRQDPSKFLINPNGAVSSDRYDEIMSSWKWRGREVWVERVLYFDNEKIRPYLLVSHISTLSGENVISFNLHPFQFGFPLSPDGIDTECSRSMFRDAMDKIFANKFIMIAPYVRLEHEDDTEVDVILKKQDLDTTFLRGINIRKCVYSMSFNSCISNGGGRCIPSNATTCFSDKSEMVSGRELLVANGYYFDISPFLLSSEANIAKLAHRGVWGACMK